MRWLGRVGWLAGTGVGSRCVVATGCGGGCGGGGGRAEAGWWARRGIVRAQGGAVAVGDVLGGLIAANAPRCSGARGYWGWRGSGGWAGRGGVGGGGLGLLRRGACG